MSELKAFNCVESDLQEFCEPRLVYLKDDADKVIAAQDKEIQRLENLCESYRIDCDNLAIREVNSYKEIERDNKQIIHQKHKRCLAMADKCVDLCHKAKDLYRWAEDENLEHHYNHKIEFFARWHKRWLEIAEKFKETK